ncbi:restriction endonuclease subunit S [Aeromonas jandaei]|uniref:restriction endonuclease subunit S n=1 Tax=Aeromonas jandaei TaxID=650 RepID=UPI00191ED6AD|nr:restriction endonuclease subunit S [Aeromonas jandaei]MBL0665494.1 restriction endonuclease subunit S [Aeromonas jandaei]
MKQYPAYPAYKTTGCDWFPEIPSHWGIDRAKWSITSCQNGVWGAEPDGDDDLACIRVADFDRQSLRVSTEKLTMRSIAEKDRRNRLLNKGDLLLEKSGGGEQQLVGAVVEFNQLFPAVTSNFIARMVASDGMNSRFLVYLHSHLYSGRVNFRSIKQTTGIQNLDSQAYLDEPITYPPLDEQQAIARFLDFKTAQIDALIAKKKSLLDKLAEKRTALISHAVTKGLDPSVPMQDSEVQWLGDIPAHWKTTRIKFVARVGNGSTPSRDKPDYWVDGFFPWLNSSVVNQEAVTESDQFVTDLALKECHLPIIQPPAVLVGITGQGKTRGMASKLSTIATINQHLAYIKPTTNDIRVDYLLFLFERAYSFLRSESDGGGSTKGAITCEQIANLEIPLPPASEQAAIEVYVADELEMLRNMNQRVANVVEKLQEYRSALITNTVTGKIDVRGFQVPRTDAEVAV